MRTCGLCGGFVRSKTNVVRVFEYKEHIATDADNLLWCCSKCHKKYVVVSEFGREYLSDLGYLNYKAILESKINVLSKILKYITKGDVKNE